MLLAVTIYLVGVGVIGIGGMLVAGWHSDPDPTAVVPIALMWPLLAGGLLAVAPFWGTYKLGEVLRTAHFRWQRARDATAKPSKTGSTR